MPRSTGGSTVADGRMLPCGPDGVVRAVERGDVLDDAAGERLGSEPDALEDRVPLGMVEELLGDAVLAERECPPARR